MLKLEFNSDDVLVLRHFGQAMTNMANELDGSVTSVTPTTTSVVTRVEPVESVEQDDTDDTVEPVESNDKIDANGLPWDERIHSSSKARNKDDTWKARRGVDDETREAVEAELRTLMAIPVEEPTDPKPTSAPNVETNQDSATVSQPDTEATPPPPPVNHDSIVSADPAIGVVKIPKSESSQDVPPPPPVVTESPAPVGNTPDVAEDSVSFVDITKYITGTMVKTMGWQIPDVNKLLTDKYGVTFATLKPREDLYPQVMAFLKGQPAK